ncbi:MAG: DUF5915 domain-containing protein, partial [Victivallaceae bacterium]
GTPLPIWRNEEGETICIGSVEELEKLSGEKICDLHKHFMDKIIIPSPTGKSPLKRIPEVLDCWFESGAMPYAQHHYPFENKEHFEAHYPADFIAEGQDQTRGWFYTLVVLGAALFDKPAFQNVIVNGMILAEDGQKMSKRKKNYPDPMFVVNHYGADALRLFMLSSQVVRSEDLRFSENGIKEVLRGVMIPIWNAYSFLVTYANVDHWEPAPGGATPQNLSNPLDRWILSSLTQMTEEIQNEMDNYNLQKAATRFTRFVDDLTNWYIRRSRRRFWKSQNDADKSEAYQTLHYALLTFARTAAPFIPFVTETIYQNLRTEDMPESVHLCDYPQADNSRRDETLEKQMENTMTAARLGRFLRSQSNLKTRQPLAKAVIVAADPETRILLKETADIIGEELNVKEIVFSADENELVTYSAKANFKTLGPKLGKMMKEAANAIQSFSSVEVAAILAGTERQITLSDGNSVAIATSDLDLRREEKPGLTVANEGALTVALDTTLTRSLEEEGFAREFVSRIQNLRKESGLKVSDRIEIAYQVPEEWKSALTNFRDYIASETLAEKVEAADLSGTEPVILNDVSCAVKVSKI